MAAVACMDTAQPLQHRVPITVTLRRLGAPASAPVSLSTVAVADEGMMAARVALSAVDSLVGTVTRVEFPGHADDADSSEADATDADSTDADSSKADDGDHGWLSADVTGNGHINLLALPSDAEAGLLILSDSLPPGSYGKLRLFIEDLTIWFNTPIQVGKAALDAGVGHGVTLPSGDHSGLKTRTGFTVPEEGGEIPILFDASGTVAHITVTGSGKVILAPVLHIKN